MSVTTTTASGTTTTRRPPGGAPPALKGGWPLLGHVPHFVRDTIGLLHRARAECGDVASFNLAGRKVMLFTGPQAQEEVFRADDEILNPNAAYKLMIPIFGKGVAYDCEPARMTEQMMMLLPAIQHKRLKTYTDAIVEEVDGTLADWGKNGTIDIYRYAQVLTNFTSSRTLLGPEFRNELNEEFSALYHQLERAIVPISYLNANLPLPVFRRRDRARARLGELVSDIVQKRRREGFEGQDFLQTLMEAEYKTGERLTDHEITGLLIATMFAGHHTSSVTFAWTLLELLRHPAQLKEVVDEIFEVLGPDEPVTYEALRRLDKTEWAIKEALRLHPPLFILFRVAMQDTQLMGYDVPEGTWVGISPTVAHQIEAVFKDASSFDIHRYGPDRKEDRQAFAFIAFGGGRHKCLGSAFALLQIKTILATLLRRFEFDLAGDPIEPDFQGMVIGPKMPIRVTYQAVEPAS